VKYLDDKWSISNKTKKYEKHRGSNITETAVRTNQMAKRTTKQKRNRSITLFGVLLNVGTHKFKCWATSV